MNPRIALLTGVTLACATGLVCAENLAYITTGEHCETLITDIPSRQAETVKLPRSSQPSLSSAQLIEQMLRAADDLAAARHEREAARTRQRMQWLKLQRLKLQAPVRQQGITDVDNDALKTWPIAIFPFHRARQRPGYAHGHDNTHPRPEPAPSQPERTTKSFRFRPDT